MDKRILKPFSFSYVVKFVLISFLTILALELVVRLVVPKHTPATDRFRIKNEFRGWPEYIGTQSRKGTESVILINNSKGNTQEIKDNKNLYSAQLQKLIENNRRNENIENWSVPGITSSQIEVLLVTAASLDVKEVVLILSASNFDHISKFKFNNHHADVDLLVGRPSTWPLLKHTYSLSDITSNSIALRYLMLKSRLFRSRYLLEDFFGETLNFKYFHTLFGRELKQPHPKVDESFFKDFAEPRQAPTKRMLNAQTGESWYKSLMVNQKITLDKVFETISALEKNAGLKTTVIFEPIRPWHNDEVEMGFSKFFDEQCEEHKLVRCFNWTQLLDGNYFYKYRLGSHYDVRGNKIMSEALFEALF